MPLTMNEIWSVLFKEDHLAAVNNLDQDTDTPQGKEREEVVTVLQLLREGSLSKDRAL